MVEELEILNKLFLEGQVLQASELNLLISSLRSTIEKVNELITIENEIAPKRGHTEYRYKNSLSEPDPPQQGTTGLNLGWTDSPITPDFGSGEYIWVTLTYVLISGEYSEPWSRPCRISGNNGSTGKSGNRGNFISRVFCRSSIEPPFPIGGDYDNPIPTNTDINNNLIWSDGIPQTGSGRIWTSLRLFYGDSNHLPTAWSRPTIESDSHSLDIEYSDSETEPNVNTLRTVPGTSHPDSNVNWYDPNNIPNNVKIVWRAERKISGTEYDGPWTITKIIGEDGIRGKFKSCVFKRSANTLLDFSSDNDGATYDTPIPTGWSDGIPSGQDQLWMAVSEFTGEGNTHSLWTVTLLTDNFDLDIEFSPNKTCPEMDLTSNNGNTVFTHPIINFLSNGNKTSARETRERAGWWDASALPSDLTMIWRAERKIHNNLYEGDWVITRILGEQGPAGPSYDDTEVLSSLQELNNIMATTNLKLELDIEDIKRAKNIIEGLYSGLRSSTGLDYTFNLLYTLGVNGIANAISSIRTAVELLGDTYVSLAELASKVDNALSVIRTLASGNYANNALLSAVGTAVEAGIITEANLADKAASVSLMSSNDFTAASIITQVNYDKSDIKIKADKVTVDGQMVVDNIAGRNISLTGQVKASNFLAGPDSSLNIKTSGNEIMFCDGDLKKAWFTIAGGGFQLHIIGENGIEYAINWDNWAKPYGDVTFEPIPARDSSSGYNSQSYGAYGHTKVTLYKYNNTYYTGPSTETNALVLVDSKYYILVGPCYTWRKGVEWFEYDPDNDNYYQSRNDLWVGQSGMVYKEILFSDSQTYTETGNYIYLVTNPILKIYTKEVLDDNNNLYKQVQRTTYYSGDFYMCPGSPETSYRHVGEVYVTENDEGWVRGQEVISVDVNITTPAIFDPNGSNVEYTTPFVGAPDTIISDDDPDPYGPNSIHNN